MQTSPYQSWFDIGAESVNKAISSRESLLNLLKKFLAEGESEHAKYAAYGVVVRSVSIISALVSHGFRFTGEAEWLNCDSDIALIRVNRELNCGDEERKVKMMLIAVMALDKCVSQNQFSITSSAVRQSEDKEPKPIRVEVVSLPTRETTTEIVRDSGGNIKQTSQIERDAA